MKYTFRELDTFERITFKNMIGFYREELVCLLRGEIATRVLTKGDRRVLRRLGILKLRPTGNTGRLLEVSQRAKEILKSW